LSDIPALCRIKEEISMDRLEIILALAAAILFCGCGGTPRSAPAGPAPAPSTPAQTPPAPQITSGNWQFTAPSTVPGKPPLTFAGSIGHAGVAVNAILHVGGSSCFDQSTAIGLTGTVTSDGTTLTSAALNGQVVTLTGNLAGSAFNGTYRINGGCAAGEQGPLSGFNVWNIGVDLSGTFTNSAQKTFKVVGEIAQGSSASPEGSFVITGTATFDTPCFSAGTIQSGTFPSGSFILGTSIVLEVETNNGLLTFLGTLDPDASGGVQGDYTVTGGSCDDSGTAVLQLASPWDY
jgi:hypothetical protein